LKCTRIGKEKLYKQIRRLKVTCPTLLPTAFQFNFNSDSDLSEADENSDPKTSYGNCKVKYLSLWKKFW